MTALNPLELPELTNREIQDWKLDLRYSDSLKVPYKACWDMAARFLRVVGLTQKLPSPLGTVNQDSNWECGYFVRYYCEEEIRVYRGEAPWSCRINWKDSGFEYWNSVREALRADMTKKEEAYQGEIDSKSK